MWTGRAIALLAVVLLAGGVPLAGPAGLPDLLPSASAQAQQVENLSAGGHPVLAVVAEATEAQVDVGHLDSAMVPIVIRDLSVPGAIFTQSTTTVRCEVDTTEVDAGRGWDAMLDVPSKQVGRGDTKTLNLIINGGPFPSPEFVHIPVVCIAAYPEPTGPREVGNFTITARAPPYYFMNLQKGDIPPRFGPDQKFTLTVSLTNTGNQYTVFGGEATGPEGWEILAPPLVALEPGETADIEIIGYTPRGALYYASESGMVDIRYGPVDQPGNYQNQLIPVSMRGVYLHPALVPLVLVALGIMAILVFLGVLARRAVEEQILGKPVPPWRIPVEREYLKELMAADPDQFYIVRYYLMVEEHQSALLWFHSYKKATKKDRERERAWVKVSRKGNRKIKAEEKVVERLGRRWERKVARVDKQRDRKIRVLEKKLRRKERKQQRKIDRRHRKSTRKLDKRHAKKVQKATKRHERLLAKENKRVAKENKRRAKREEELLPPPDLPAPELGPPQAPERVVVEPKPLDESRYAKRAERTRARYARKRLRRERQRERLLTKAASRRDARVEKLRAHIPPEPQTHLYDSAEYVDPADVIIEDDRSLFAKLLHLPTLEEREEARRRNAVYAARVKAAKNEGDPERVEVMKKAWAEERRHRFEARREELLLARASGKEEALLAKERHRAARRRQKELVGEAKEEAREPADEPAPGPIPVHGENAAPAAPRERSGLRARFRLRKGEPEEEVNKAAEPSTQE